ncbi:hypothetical protein UPYG_G00227810 [Umbra pygmaea]|uniref:Immunoglobulin V-set domain-containing protein n=1 Tax=Umbra pygmaea TaxID=75934 RepID=A0ABD0WDR4_UMBPY
MISAVIIITVPLFWITGVSLSKEVYQSPSMMLINPEDSTTFNCSHKIQSYNTILWYYRPVEDTALILIGYMYYKSPNLESSYTMLTDCHHDFNCLLGDSISKRVVFRFSSSPDSCCLGNFSRILSCSPLFPHSERP